MRARILLLAGVLAGCGQGPADDGVLQDVSGMCVADQEALSGFNWFRLRNETPGTVRVSNTKDELVVNVAGANGWRVSHWHLYAGLGDIPVNRLGFEAPGRFPYQGYGDRQPNMEYRIPLTDLEVRCDDVLTMSLHVVFVQLDAAGKVKATMRSWGNWHVDLKARRLGGQFAHAVCCEVDPPPPPVIDCVKPPWYFAQTPDAWKVDKIALGASVYTQAQAMDLLQTDWYEENADISIALANEVIGVRLVQAEGLVLPPDIVAALAKADAFFDANKDADGRVPYGFNVDSPLGWQMYDVYLYLFDFTVGRLSVPLCGG
jgi:hypothetical protein